ncbi:MAG: ABC transporter permease [Roseiarcus sp.]
MFQASPKDSRLATDSRRNRFVILRTASSSPVALHPASRRRSYSRLPGLRPARARTSTAPTKRPHGRTIPGVAAAGAVTFQSAQTTVDGRPVRLFVEGYELGRPGGPPAIVVGHDLTESHYQIVADDSSGLRVGDRIPLGPYGDKYAVVGLTHGMVSSGGDAAAWVTLLDAQALQFEVAPALQRREKAEGRSALETADVNAVLVKVEPSASPAAVAQEVDRWKHLSAVTQQQEERYLTAFVIEKMQRQIGMFMVILIVVSAVIISLIVYTLTMDKLRSIATLKLIGAPDRTIVALIVQQALVLGVGGFAVGLVLIETFKDRFPRRVLVLPHDVTMLFLVVIVVCLLASMLGVRAALRVDPAQALAG